MPFGSARLSFEINLDSLLAGLPGADTITIDSQNAGLVEDENVAPEPSSMILLLSGLAVGCLLDRRSRPVPGCEALA